MRGKWLLIAVGVFFVLVVEGELSTEKPTLSFPLTLDEPHNGVYKNGSSAFEALKKAGTGVFKAGYAVLDEDPLRLEFLPKPDPERNEDSTLIWYNTKQRADYEFWTDQLVSYFNNIPAKSSLYVTQCSLGSGGTETYKNGNKSLEQISSCYVDNTQFGECNPLNNFGYRLGEPCILVKLNKIYGWKPEGFGLNGTTFNAVMFNEIFDSDMEELNRKLANNPNQGLKPMPRYLQYYIRREVQKPEHSDQWKTDFLNSVFVSCEGENPADKENIGPISINPRPFIPSYYFPFTNQLGYQEPFVMFQFKRPASGILINIECRAWAKNIKQNRPYRLGSGHFELLMDNY